MRRRAGYSTVELVCALLLGALVAGAAFALLQSQSRLARSATDSAETADALRTATQVLAAETRWLVPARDVRAFSADSLSLRALRGSGVVCGIDPGYGALVRYSGLRDPDPTKDSVLIEREANSEIVALVQGVVLNAACGAEPALKLAVSQPLLVGDVLLIFESGNYYLSSGALRYRIGNSGRQPVTAELLDNRRTAFNQTANGWSAVLQTLPQRGRGAAQARIRLPFLNP